MPFENSLPLVLACLALAGISLFGWTKTTSRLWLIVALLTASAGIAEIIPVTPTRREPPAWGQAQRLDDWLGRVMHGESATG